MQGKKKPTGTTDVPQGLETEKRKGRDRKEEKGKAERNNPNARPAFEKKKNRVFRGRGGEKQARLAGKRTRLAVTTERPQKEGLGAKKKAGSIRRAKRLNTQNLDGGSEPGSSIVRGIPVIDLLKRKTRRGKGPAPTTSIHTGR